MFIHYIPALFAGIFGPACSKPAKRIQKILLFVSDQGFKEWKLLTFSGREFPLVVESAALS